MKKILAFIRDNWAYILGAVCVLLFCAAFFIPLFLAIGRVMWDAAINNPTAFM